MGAPPVRPSSQEEPHHDQHDDPEERGRLRVEHAGHDAHEGAPDEEQVEEDEDEQDRARAGRDQAVGDGREAVALVPDRDDDPAVVAGPADERHAEHEPDHGGQPAPEGRGHDGADDRAGGRDRLEVVAEEDVAVRRHEVHAVHVERGRGRALGIGLDHAAVDPPGVERIRQIHRQDSDDDGQQRVHSVLPVRRLATAEPNGPPTAPRSYSKPTPAATPASGGRSGVLEAAEREGDGAGTEERARGRMATA